MLLGLKSAGMSVKGASVSPCASAGTGQFQANANRLVWARRMVSPGARKQRAAGCLNQSKHAGRRDPGRQQQSPNSGIHESGTVVGQFEKSIKAYITFVGRWPTQL